MSNLPASWNQKYNLYTLAKDNHFPKVLEELETRDILDQSMDQQRYRNIRNALVYKNPQLALKLLQVYPRKGGETNDKD